MGPIAEREGRGAAGAIGEETEGGGKEGRRGRAEEGAGGHCSNGHHERNKWVQKNMGGVM